MIQSANPMAQPVNPMTETANPIAQTDNPMTQSVNHSVNPINKTDNVSSFYVFYIAYGPIINILLSSFIKTYVLSTG